MRKNLIFLKIFFVVLLYIAISAKEMAMHQAEF